jgi:uncharacterized protein YceK
MKNLFLLIFICLILGGCATAKKTYTSDGKEGYAITCSGSALNWGMCYEKAGEIVAKKDTKFLKKWRSRCYVSGNHSVCMVDLYK